jgi:hypothetical protein
VSIIDILQEKNIQQYFCNNPLIVEEFLKNDEGHHGRDCMVYIVGFTTTYTISDYHH